MSRKRKQETEVEVPEEEQLSILEHARDLYLKLIRPAAIVRNLRKTFAISERQGYYYLEKLRDEYAPHSEQEREDEIASWLAKLSSLEGEYDEIQQLAKQDGDYSVAKSCQDSKVAVHRERAKFRGLYAPERVAHTHVVELTEAELLAEIKTTLAELPAEERQRLLGEGSEVIDVEVVEKEPERDPA